MRVFFVCVLFSFEHIIVFVVCDVWCGAFFSFLFFVCVWACVGLCEFRLSFRCLCVLFVIYGAMLFVCVNVAVSSFCGLSCDVVWFVCVLSCVCVSLCVCVLCL